MKERAQALSVVTLRHVLQRSGRDHVQRSTVKTLRHLLLNQGDARTGVPDHLPRVGRHDAHDDLQEGGLPFSVPTEQPHTLPPLDLEVRVVEKTQSAKGDIQARAGDEGHGRTIGESMRVSTRKRPRSRRRLAPTPSVSLWDRRCGCLGAQVGGCHVGLPY